MKLFTLSINQLESFLHISAPILIRLLSKKIIIAFILSLIEIFVCISLS